LFRRGRYTLLESIVEGVLAHGEMQEEKSPAPGWYFPRGPGHIKGRRLPLPSAVHCMKGIGIVGTI
jgi:hypothetical protein